MGNCITSNKNAKNSEKKADYIKNQKTNKI